MSKLKFHNGLAWEALDAANGDSVNGISFRINGGKLQYTTNGTTWYDAGTDTSDATALASHILSGYTAYVNGIKITGTIPSKGAQTFTPGTSNQTISAGQYLSGTQTIAGDADLTAANIRYGANVFNVAGTFSYTTAGATAAQIQSGRVAFVNGAQVNGTAPAKGAQTYTPGTTNQTIASGQILTGTQTILGDADLVAANIKSGVNIFNVTGTLPSPTLVDGVVASHKIAKSSSSMTAYDGIVVDESGGYVYVAYKTNTTFNYKISKHRLSDLVEVDSTIDLDNTYTGMVADADYLYILSMSNNLKKVRKSDMAVVLSAVVSSSIEGIAVDDTYVYGLHETNGRMYYYLKSTLGSGSFTSSVTFNCLTKSDSSVPVCSDSTHIYFVRNDSRIGKIDMASRTLVTTYTTTDQCNKIVNGGSYVYALAYLYSKVFAILKSNLSLQNTLTSSRDVFASDDRVYVNTSAVNLFYEYSTNLTFRTAVEGLSASLSSYSAGAGGSNFIILGRGADGGSNFITKYVNRVYV